MGLYDSFWYTRRDTLNGTWSVVSTTKRNPEILRFSSHYDHDIQGNSLSCQIWTWATCIAKIQHSRCVGVSGAEFKENHREISRNGKFLNSIEIKFAIFLNLLKLEFHDWTSSRSFRERWIAAWKIFIKFQNLITIHLCCTLLAL